jgi:transcriptional/translational regulatory protein YebC/TACO1
MRGVTENSMTITISTVKVITLIERLEDLDDTQDVFSNADIPPEAYEQL